MARPTDSFKSLAAKNIPIEAVLTEQKYRWGAHAREAQLPPAGDWRVWFYLGGRGAGKTRAGAEHIRSVAESGVVERIALVAPTAADARDVMVEGESGLLSVHPERKRPLYEPSKRRLTWPNGVLGTLYMADEPERLRGPQHGYAWADELAAWRYPETWDMLMLGLRLGDNPRCVVTSTPKPSRLVKALLLEETTAVTRSSTWDNADNLAAPFLEKITAKYQGTRLGRQELDAELLEDNPDALWNRSMIDGARVSERPVDGFARVVVGLDPSTTATGDEAGIIAAGLGHDGDFYVLGDWSVQGSPAVWAERTRKAYNFSQADKIVYESNQGGEMVAGTLRTVDAYLPLKAIHASRGKVTRAEPIAALYEQGRVHHVGGFQELEEEMCEWTQGDPDSPNRLDALVHALTELQGKGYGAVKVFDRRLIGI